MHAYLPSKHRRLINMAEKEKVDEAEAAAKALAKVLKRRAEKE